MASELTTVLLDTHVIQWWSAEPKRLSRRAAEALADADGLAVAGISWFELAWLASRDRIVVSIPVRSWLEQLSEQLRTVGITPAIADAAVSPPHGVPGRRGRPASSSPRPSNTAGGW